MIENTDQSRRDCQIALILAGMVVLGVLVPMPVPIRLLLVALFLLVAPGLAVTAAPDVRRLGGVVVVAVSLATDVVISEVVMYAGFWSGPRAILAIAAVTGLISLYRLRAAIPAAAKTTPEAARRRHVARLGDELSRFLSRRTFQRFEITPTREPLESADPVLIERLAAAFGWPTDSDLSSRLEDAGFLARDGARQMLTVAGGLLLLAEPGVIGGRPYVELHRYTPDGPEPDKTCQSRGPADAQVELATRSILDELGSVSAVVGMQRIEMPKVPPGVIREAMVNAVAHRSYEHAGTAIQVAIYPTHLTITSPGGLPEPVTLENLRSQQSARNDSLFGALVRLGLAEDLGKGIDRIEDDMADELLRPPEFADDGSCFSVTLQLRGAVSAPERAWVRSLVQAGKLDGQAARIVVSVAREGSITNSEVRSMLSVDTVEARSMLRSLVSLGVLRGGGERGGAAYYLAPDIGGPAGIRHTDVELEEIALELARRGAVTNASLRARTGLDRHKALKVLRRLVDHGHLVQRGQMWGVHYELS